MPPRPTLDPQVIADILCDHETGERRSPAEMAELLSTEERPISTDLVQSTLYRHVWPYLENPPEARPGQRGAMKYQMDKDLGPIAREHKKYRDYRLMRCIERITVGIQEVESEFTEKARFYQDRRLNEGLVTDYDRDSETGWWTRPAFPWELGHYYRQAMPDEAIDIVRLFLNLHTLSPESPYTMHQDGLSVPMTEDHLNSWQSWLDSRI